MASERELEEQRNRMRDFSRPQLLHEKSRWLPHAAQAIVATELLDALDQKDEQARHTESLSVAHHANRLSRWAIVIAVVAGSIAAASLLFQILDRANRDTPATPGSPSSQPLSSMQPTGSVVSSIVVTSTPPTNPPAPKP